MNQDNHEPSASKNIAKSIGRVLVTCRQSVGLTQVKVAKKLGVSTEAN